MAEGSYSALSTQHSALLLYLHRPPALVGAGEARGEQDGRRHARMLGHSAPRDVKGRAVIHGSPDKRQPHRDVDGLDHRAAAGEGGGDVAAGGGAWRGESVWLGGVWVAVQFTGTGFPRDFLIRYHLYRIVWPVIALARLRRALA